MSVPPPHTRPPLRIGAPDGRPPPAGWSVRDGFDLPAEPWDLSPHRWVCRGTVGDDAAAGAALLALARGVGLDVTVTLAGQRRQRFLEDASRAGDPGGFEGPQVLAGLGTDHRALLDALVAGETVTAAAAALHLSRRTANRRLSEARTALGASTTAEAVRIWADRRPT